MSSLPSLGLDHLVVLVDNLDSAAATYEAFGFTVAPEMRHPFGTANRLVTLDGNFIELVGVVDPDHLTGPGPLIADRLATAGSGPFGVAIISNDAATDHELLQDRGLNPGAIGDGKREVPHPNGTTIEARFSTILLPNPPGVPFIWFLAQQHVPEAVWISEWQSHRNGAAVMTAIQVYAEDPNSLLSFLTRLYGAKAAQESPGSATVTTPRGRIEVLSKQAVRDRFGDMVAPLTEQTQVVGATIATSSLSIVGALPHAQKETGRVIIPAQFAYGLALEFIVD